MYAKNIRPCAKRDEQTSRPRRAQTRERSALQECAREARRSFYFHFVDYFVSSECAL